MKNFIVKNFYYLGAIGLFFIIFIINSSQVYAVGETCNTPAGAANASCCTAPPIIELTGGCASGQYWEGSASGGKCVDNPSSTCTEKFSCLTGGCVNRDTNRWARVLYDSLPGGEDVFKIWYSGIKGRLISLADVDCNDGQVPTWDNTAKIWECADSSGVWTKKVDSKVYYNGGNVGIGTNDPGYTLEVNGDTNITGDLTVGGTTTLNDVNITGDKSGLMAEFVGLTVNTNGSVGGYTQADNLCGAVIVGSHVCSSEEIINSYRVNASALTGVNNSAWINNGPPGYIKYPNNDCSSLSGGGGWTEGVDEEIFGSIWNFSRKEFKVRTCNSSIPFACCM